MKLFNINSVAEHSSNKKKHEHTMGLLTKHDNQVVLQIIKEKKNRIEMSNGPSLLALLSGMWTDFTHILLFLGIGWRNQHHLPVPTSPMAMDARGCCWSWSTLSAEH